MKVAFTHNLRLTDVRETEKEAEYDSAETVSAIAAAIRRLVRSGATSVVLRPSEDERDLSSFLEVVSSVLALDHDPPTVGS